MEASCDVSRGLGSRQKKNYEASGNHGRGLGLITPGNTGGSSRRFFLGGGRYHAKPSIYMAGYGGGRGSEIV